jgi:hypothetical protein
MADEDQQGPDEQTPEQVEAREAADAETARKRAEDVAARKDKQKGSET